MNSRNTFLATALLVAATIGPNAAAEPAQDAPPIKVVSYSDLNLNSAAGVTALYRRIQKAADEVCDLPADVRELPVVYERRACKARATQRAVAHVGVPALNALHLARTGRDPGPAQVAIRK